MPTKPKKLSVAASKFTADQRAKIGPAIWTFFELKMMGVNSEGYVDNAHPVTANTLAVRLGLHAQNVRGHLDRLSGEGWIACDRRRNGVVIRILDAVDEPVDNGRELVKTLTHELVKSLTHGAPPGRELAKTLTHELVKSLTLEPGDTSVSAGERAGSSQTQDQNQRTDRPTLERAENPQPEQEPVTELLLALEAKSPTADERVARLLLQKARLRDMFVGEEMLAALVFAVNVPKSGVRGDGFWVEAVLALLETKYYKLLQRWAADREKASDSIQHGVPDRIVQMACRWVEICERKAGSK